MAARTDDGAPAMIPIARQMLAIEEAGDAIEVLKRFVKAHPQDIDSLNFLCRTLVQTERISEAREHARAFPTSAAAEIGDLRQLAALYRACEDFTRFEMILKQILARPDHAIEDHAQLIELFANRPRPLREATAEMARFLGRWRDDPMFWKTAAKLHHAIAYKLSIRGRAFRRTVIRSAENALKQTPDDNQFRAWYATTLRIAKCNLRSLWQLRQLERFSGGDLSAHISCCELAVSFERTRQFQRVAARAVTLPTTDNAKLFRLSRVLWKGGMSAETFASLARIDLDGIGELGLLTQIVEFATLCGANHIGLAAVERMRILRPDSTTAKSLETTLRSTSEEIEAMFAGLKDRP